MSDASNELAGFVRVDHAARIVEVNAAAARLVGTPAAQLVGASIDTILSAASRVYRHMQLVPVLAVDAGIDEVSLTLRGPGGRTVPVLLRIVVRADEVTGRREELWVFLPMRRRSDHEDQIVAARREADAALAAQARAMATVQAIMDAAPVGIFEVDGDGRCAFVNERWSQLTGLSAADAEGDGWLRAVHPDDREVYETAWRRAQADRRELVLEHRLATGDGSRWVATRLVRVPEEGGRRGAFLGTITDTTELHVARRQVARQTRLASVGTLASGFAHEVNNPLAIVLSSAEQIVEDGGGDVVPLARAIVDAATRIRRVVTDLGSLARGADEPPRVVDLRQVAEAGAQLVDRRLGTPSRLLRSLGETPPVIAVETRLLHVVVNLLLNAFDAVEAADEPDAVVHLRTFTDARGNPVLEVEDEGVGLDDATAEHLFDPFFTSKPVGRATGLGLWVVRDVVRSHRGDIEVAPGRRRGTVLRVVLPPAPGAARAEGGSDADEGR